MAITPDTKDWTWVLERVCPECGFDVRSFPVTHVGSLIRTVAETWNRVLATRTDTADRPSHDVWSPLEYACHVRDVFALYGERLQLILTREDPTFPNWDQDATAHELRYAEQDPRTVATQLRERADELARSFDQVSGSMWERRGRRSDGASFTVATFARYLIHDPIHHLHDVGEPPPTSP